MYISKELIVSERRACVVLGQHRFTQRRLPIPRDGKAIKMLTVIDEYTRESLAIKVDGS